MSEHYGTVPEADVFFSNRLHTYDWDRSTAADKKAAMVQATELIDQFEYLGDKYSVQVVLDSLGDCADFSTEENQELLRQADLAQPLLFPRGDSKEIPEAIDMACYLIAKALLSGRDPDIDLENLAIKSASYGGVRTNYQREGNNQEHIAHLIPSPEAWTLIRPFLRERDLFDIKRVS